MTIPGFSAEASLAPSKRRYEAMWRPMMNADAQPQFSSAILHRPIPLPVPDPCSACISDCMHRPGGNYFSCRNLCSFVCF